jgi:hypothetical protein
MRPNRIGRTAAFDRIVLFSVILTFTSATQLSAQNWLEPPAGLPHQEAVALTSLTGSDGPVDFAEYGQVKSTKGSCACGGNATCGCGACDACCGCSTGWLHSWGSWISPWDGTLELGLNGADGNTQNTNFFFGFDTMREYTASSFKFDLDYFYQTADSVVTMDRLVALSRYERNLGNSIWKWYLEGFYEYDQLRNYNARMAISTGLSAPLIDTDRLSIDGRAGLSGSKKLDGPDDDWRPELQFGIDYDYQLTQRQRFFGFVDYYPDISDFGTYRLNYKLAWEALLEEEYGLALRASLLNWYDSNPGPGTKANDLFYVLSLVWGY